MPGTVKSDNVGASFTGVIAMETETSAESNEPSLTLKINESDPLALALGV